MTEKSSTAQIRAPKVYGLTKKRKKVAKLVGLQGANPTEAVRETFDTKHPSQMAYKIMKDPKVQAAVQTFQQYIDKKVSDKYMADKGFELLNAEVDGTPHYQIQQKQWDSFAKIKGYYPSDSQKHLHLHQGKDVLEEMYEDLDSGVIEGEPHGANDQG